MKNGDIFQSAVSAEFSNTFRTLLSCFALFGRLLPSATTLLQGYVFTGICDSVHRVGGMHCQGIMHGWEGACVTRGYVWQGVSGRGAFVLGGGMHSGGACMAGGCAWWGQGGMLDWGYVWQGACITGGMSGRGHAYQGGHVWQGWRAWQERRPLQRTIRILLESILVQVKKTLTLLILMFKSSCL